MMSQILPIVLGPGIFFIYILIRICLRARACSNKLAIFILILVCDKACIVIVTHVGSRVLVPYRICAIR